MKLFSYIKNQKRLPVIMAMSVFVVHSIMAQAYCWVTIPMPRPSTLSYQHSTTRLHINKYIGAISFHSWRGCDDETLNKWAEASRQINVPLIVGEGSTDAAAHQYPAIFNESTFALYEINLYLRLCAICQPLSILQWQLTSDYSPLWGDGIYGSKGPLHPTQRFFNLMQLAMTPQDAFAVPVSCDKENIQTAGFVKMATGEWAIHLVNNGASCESTISGLPVTTKEVVVYVTTHRHTMLNMQRKRDIPHLSGWWLSSRNVVKSSTMSSVCGTTYAAATS